MGPWPNPTLTRPHGLDWKPRCSPRGAFFIERRLGSVTIESARGLLLGEPITRISQASTLAQIGKVIQVNKTRSVAHPSAHAFRGWAQFDGPSAEAPGPSDERQPTGIGAFAVEGDESSLGGLEVGRRRRHRQTMRRDMK
jgi:hypothetical protein